MLAAVQARLVLVLLLVLAASARAAEALRADRLPALDAAIEAAIATNRIPGGVLWLERQGATHVRALGRRAVAPASEPMTADTVFDAASLTKVVATAPAVMKLVGAGRVLLDAPVKTYLPEFTGEGRDAVTVRHLLTHTSGLRPGIPLRPDWSGYGAGIALALAEKPTAAPDAQFRYSDVNFILLGELVRRVGGRPLDEFCAAEIFGPLGMRDTLFRPPAARRPRVAPTTLVDGEYLRGVVHDPTARRMGGVAGHAGLFTTAADLARFSRMLLNDGALDGVRVLDPLLVRLMASVQTPAALPAARRGLGWDIDSPYAGPRGEVFPVGSFGHTGWTGTSLWVDSFSRTFVIFLSNRNHPTEDGNVLALRRQLGTLAAQAVAGFDFADVPGALPRQAKAAASADTGGVRNGIDVLAAQGFAPLRGKKVGLITNHTGHDRVRNPTIDLLHAAPDVALRALFSPEHGIRGLLDEKVSDSVDEQTGLPVFSLYGETRKPRPEQLAGLDALVFDIQDIGCRFYTYISTMSLAMEAAAEAGLKFLVLDRVNPINGVAVEGPVHRGTNTFVAAHAIPLRHGMTVGELARMMNAERKLGADLTVVPVEGWRRGAWFDGTGLPWTNPSPNMRNLKQAILYPGVGLLESALSVGRGTDTPFEVVGAPYADDVALARELNAAGLPGVRFVPIRFTPRASTFKDQPCGGVYLMLNDREACPVVDVGVVVALTFRRLYPEQFALEKLRPLLTDERTLEAIRAGKSLAEIKALWASDLGEFKARRGSFLLY
jgi:uncharacterized protein YbbC (DUF1343 family)/CubicO group peptidase (beta-lactamase class C family)